MDVEKALMTNNIKYLLEAPLTIKEQEYLVNNAKTLELLFVMSNPCFDRIFYKTLINHEDYLIRAKLASFHDLPEDMQIILTEDISSEVRKTMAANPTLPKHLHSKVAKDIFSVRSMLAKNPSLDESVIPKLMEDILLHPFIALNPSLSVPFQEKLLHTSTSETRACLAKNPGLAPHLVRLLADDYSWRVRMEVAKRSDLDYDTQKKLLLDGMYAVEEAMALNPHLLEELKQDEECFKVINKYRILNETN